MLDCIPTYSNTEFIPYDGVIMFLFVFWDLR